MRGIRWRSAAALSVTVGAFGCGDPMSPEKPGRAEALDEATVTQLEPRKVAPQATDPEIRDPRWLSEHYVWLDRARDRREKLFVHMPGVGNPPSSGQLLAKEAARLGYHVIVLSYPFTWEIAICKGDPDCERNVRFKVLDGKGPVILAKDGITRIDVTPTESIDNRLTKLLRHLATHSPEEEGWSEFLHDGSPKWKKIVIGGHSFGGSQAALIAKLHRVHRVTLFAAPRDFSLGQKGGWIALGKTASKRYYGLVHNQDPRCALTLASWAVLDMFDAALLERVGAGGTVGDCSRHDPGLLAQLMVEDSAPPYGKVQTLLTDLLPSTGTYANAHGSVARDLFTPLSADGTPALRDAWRYMLGADEQDEDRQDEDVQHE